MEKEYKEDLTGNTIMGRAPHIAYYLNMSFEVFPFTENYEDLIRVVKIKT